jgi:putative lipoic acid-binding regulatory protein
MEDSFPVCEGPFGDARLTYPLHFDLRVIYLLDAAPSMADNLSATLKRIGIACSLIQAVAKPGAKYGRIGARVTVSSKTEMDKLYKEVAKLPGVKSVI